MQEQTLRGQREAVATIPVRVDGGLDQGGIFGSVGSEKQLCRAGGVQGADRHHACSELHTPLREHLYVRADPYTRGVTPMATRRH